MKTKQDDCLTEALTRLRQTAAGEGQARKELSASPVSSDIGELFLAELQARRERLKHWIRLLNEEARLGDGCAPVVCGSRHKCRGLGLPPHAERRLSARRHSTAA
ncbi:MAG: hypothetical protein ABSH44_14485 [Bryobacteraceae bacterium]|jgi:hypothetical protein